MCLLQIAVALETTNTLKKEGKDAELLLLLPPVSRQSKADQQSKSAEKQGVLSRKKTAQDEKVKNVNEEK